VFCCLLLVMKRRTSSHTLQEIVCWRRSGGGEKNAWIAISSFLLHHFTTTWIVLLRLVGEDVASTIARTILSFAIPVALCLDVSVFRDHSFSWPGHIHQLLLDGAVDLQFVAETLCMIENDCELTRLELYAHRYQLIIPSGRRVSVKRDKVRRFTGSWSEQQLLPSLLEQHFISPESIEAVIHHPDTAFSQGLMTKDCDWKYYESRTLCT
jgi:hypothetical protein